MVGPGLLRRPRRAPPARPARMAEALLAGEATGGLLRDPAAGPPRPRATRRRASASSTTSPSPPATRSTRSAPRAGLHPRLGRPPRRRHERHLPRDGRGAVREHPPGRALPRHRAAARRRARAPGEGFSINLPVPKDSGRGHLGVAARAHRDPRRRGVPARTWCSISAGYDAHRDDEQGGCELEAASYAEMARHVRALGERAGAPVGAVLEGGYALDALAGLGVRRRWRRSPATSRRTRSRPTSLTARAASHIGHHWSCERGRAARPRRAAARRLDAAPARAGARRLRGHQGVLRAALAREPLPALPRLRAHRRRRRATTPRPTASTAWR